MPNVCPECHKDDAIQKVTSITAAGEASGTFSGPSVGLTRVDGKWGTTGGYTTLSGHTTTELARMLQPPVEPAKPGGIGCAGVLFFIAVSIMFATIGGAGLVIGFIALSDSGESAVVRILVFLLLLGCAAFGFFGLFQAIKYFGKDDQKKKETSAARYATEKPAWDAAMRRYTRSYYCFRDDIVFDPETAASCNPVQLAEYLYSEN